MNVIMEGQFGSHLYGTNTELSDMDIKGIFLPSMRETLLNRVPKSVNLSSNKTHSKNTKDDMDIEYYSLHYFLKLACDNETVAIDMLHTDDKNLLVTSPIWKAIVINRQKFYTKNLKAFLGYAKRQADKYGIKGSRIAILEQVLSVISSQESNTILKEITGLLPQTDLSSLNDEFYEVCGKKFNITVKVSYMQECLQKYLKQYGNRAHLAKTNEGVDWKAVSHAVRAALQVIEILTTNNLVYPLKEKELLLQIKQGNLSFVDEVEPLLIRLIDEAENLAEKSSLPAKVDREFWDDFLVNVIKNSYLRG